MDQPVKRRIEELRGLIRRHLKLKEWSKKVKECPDSTKNSIDQADNLIKVLNNEIEDFRAEMYTLMAQVTVSNVDDNVSILNQSTSSPQSIEFSNQLIDNYKKELAFEQDIKSGAQKMIEANKEKMEVVNNDLLLLYHDSIVKIEYLRMLILKEKQRQKNELYYGSSCEPPPPQSMDSDGFTQPKFMELSADKIKTRIQNARQMIKGALDIEEQKNPQKGGQFAKSFSFRNFSLKDENDRLSFRGIISNVKNSPPSSNTQATDLIHYLRQSIIIYERWLKKNSQNQSVEINDEINLFNQYSKNAVVSGCLRIKFLGVVDLDNDLIKDSRACSVEKNKISSCSSLFSSDPDPNVPKIYLEAWLDQRLVYSSPSCIWSKFCFDSKAFEYNLLKNKDIEFVVKSSTSNVMVGLTTVPLLGFLDGEKYKLKIPLFPQGFVFCKAQYFMPKPRKARVVRQKQIFFKSRAILTNGQICDIKYLDMLKNLRLDKQIGGFTAPKQFSIDRIDETPRIQTYHDNIVKASVAIDEIPRAESPYSTGGKAEPQGIGQRTSSFNKLNIHCFKMKNVLGEGHFGKVILAEMIQSNELYAIKAITKQSIVDNNDFEMLSVEKRILMLSSTFKHPFLLHMLGCFPTEHHVCYALEYIQGGDLLAHVNIKIFNQPRAVFYTSCLLLALEFLHKNGIMYRDLKLDNVLMMPDGYIKLGDFGLSKPNMWHDVKTYTFCGTPEFIAPEVLSERGYTRSVDWWELGILMYEMMVGEAPFDGEDQDEIFDAITSNELKQPHSVSKTSWDIIEKLLKKNPDIRLGSTEEDADAIKRHPFFNGVNFDDIYDKKLKPEYLPVFKNGQMTFVEPEFSRLSPTLDPPESVTNFSPSESKYFDSFYYSAF
ncbi:Serine/threonine-protein kinase N1 [Thelohanellus kitauei]|uniref:Serine/threonine-protein kinase N1 n=1 Tax=Thelohanellus kitauei TaxID=669202 RepID=A0A0C2MY83_THEKT|nr:Serine/threonine-protein kinase N1 [Thelohanellus kitauei]